MKSVLAIVLSFFFLITTVGYSQGKWRKGMIVTNNLDTLKGYISYKDFSPWSGGSQVVNYRQSIRSKDWAPYNIKDLIFCYDSSVSASLEYIYQYEMVRGNRVLNEKRTDSINKIPVWMNILVQGEQVSLLTWNKLFFLKMDGNVTPLNYYIYNEYGGTIQESQYIRTLLGIARSLGFSNRLDFEITSCGYDIDALTEVVIHMNYGKAIVCYDQTPRFYTISLLGGSGISSAKISYNDYSMSVSTTPQSGLPYYSRIPLHFGIPVLMNFNAGIDLGVTYLPLRLRVEGSYTTGRMDARSPAGSNQNYVYRHNPKNFSTSVSLIWDLIEHNRYKVWLGLGSMDVYKNNKENIVYDLNSNKAFQNFIDFDGTTNYLFYRIGLLINKRLEISATVNSNQQLSWGTKQLFTRPFLFSINYHLPTIKISQHVIHHPLTHLISVADRFTQKTKDPNNEFTTRIDTLHITKAHLDSLKLFPKNYPFGEIVYRDTLFQYISVTDTVKIWKTDVGKPSITEDSVYIDYNSAGFTEIILDISKRISKQPIFFYIPLNHGCPVIHTDKRSIGNILKLVVEDAKCKYIIDGSKIYITQ